MKALVKAAVFTVAGGTLLSGAGFIVAAYFIRPICGYLGLPVLLFLLSYSYAKRFTFLAHLWLGLALLIMHTAQLRFGKA